MKLFFALVAVFLVVAPLRGQTYLTVAADGSGQFKTVQEAIMSVPSGSAPNPVIIHIKPGTYRELIYVQREKSFFRLIGDDPAKTIISFNLYAGMTNVDGKALGTFKTPTATIDADNFTAENITFENSAGAVGQALAIRVDGDRAAFHHCRFLGWQDTILVNRGRQYFDDCYIEGHVDFIFGAATTWFENCHIHCLRDGYVTAASTPQDQPYGYVFSHCKIDGESGVKSFLGRPWRLYASVTYLNCDLSDVIRPEGWNDWKKEQAHITTRYAEFNSTGAGANPQARADWTKQLTASEAKKITVEKVLSGADLWMPAASFYATSQDIVYGEAGGEKLLLDVHVPDGDGKFPVAIIVHGGGWSTWNKESDIVPVLAPFATNFTWFTINYRLAPTNRWPACFDDVQTAIRWVKQHAPEYKGDPSRIALIGYSAGGHLVCYAATQATPDTRVQAVVGLAPPTDITADAQRRGSLDKWKSMEDLLGRNSLDDETLRIMREISPSEHISSDLPPFLLVQGNKDTAVPYNLTPIFAAKLKAANVPCEFITITNATHTIADWYKFDPEWQNQVVTWLNEQLASK
jgi:pectinesterase